MTFVLVNAGAVGVVSSTHMDSSTDGVTGSDSATTYAGSVVPATPARNETNASGTQPESSNLTSEPTDDGSSPSYDTALTESGSQADREWAVENFSDSYRSLHDTGFNHSWWQEQSQDNATKVAKETAKDLVKLIPSAIKGGPTAPAKIVAKSMISLTEALGRFAVSIHTDSVGTQLRFSDSDTYDDIRADIEVLEENSNDIRKASNDSEKRPLFEERKVILERLYLRLPSYLHSVRGSVYDNPAYDIDISPIPGTEWRLGTTAYGGVRAQVELLRLQLVMDYQVTTSWLQNETTDYHLAANTSQDMPMHHLGFSQTTARIYDTIDTPDDYAVYKLHVDSAIAGSGKNLRVRLQSPDQRNFTGVISDSAPSSISDPDGDPFVDHYGDKRAFVSDVSAGEYYVVVKTQNSSTLPYKLVATVFEPKLFGLVELNKSAPELSAEDRGITHSATSPPDEPRPFTYVSVYPEDEQPPGDREVLRPGETAIVNVTIANRGGTADWQSIAVSFPQLSDGSRITVLDHSLEQGRTLDPGTPVGATYGTSTVNLTYPLAEGHAMNWTTGEVHYLKLKFEVPTGFEGRLKLQVKSVAKSAQGWTSDPALTETTAVDQQSEFVFTRAVTVSSTATSVDEDWTKHQFDDSNTGYSPNGSTPPENVVRRWTFDANGPIHSSPAVVGGIAYFGSDDTNVYAINTTTGNKVWSYKTSDSIRSSLTVFDGTVYVGSNDGKVYALDANTGARVWSFEPGAAVDTSLVVFNGTVYAGAKNGRIYALDSQTGTLEWSANLGNRVSGPALSNGVLYVTVAADNGEDIRVAALKPQTGNTSWNVRLAQEWDERTPSKIGAPAVVDGTVYVGGWVNERTYALDVSDGSVIWNTATGDVVTSPAVADGVVYVTSQDHRVYMLRAIDGTKLQSFETAGPMRSSPVIADGIVHVGSVDQFVYGLNKNGTNEEWRIWARGKVTASVAVADEMAFVGTDSGQFIALESRENPIATADQTPFSSATAASIRFDAADSSDRTGRITSFDWDFDNDGSFDASGAEQNHTFRTPGEHHVRLRLTDDEGATTSLTKTVRIIEAANWPSFGYTLEKTGYNPVGTPPRGNIEAEWSRDFRTSMSASGAAVNGTLYLGSDDGDLYALNATSGATEWAFKSGGAVKSSPTVFDGTVFVGSNDGKVYALDAASGALEWSFEPGAAVETSPVVFNGTVYVGASNGRVYALDSRSGAKKWSVNLGNEVSGPALSNGVLYVTVAADNGEDIRVAALDAETGVTKWNVRLAQEWDERTPSKIGAPAVVDGTVYVGGWVNERTYALDASDGSVSWSTGTGDVVTSPAVAEGVVYVGSKDGRVYALNGSTGSKLQSYQTDAPIRSSPIVVRDLVLVGSDDKHVYALNTSGLGEEWKVFIGGAVPASPSVADQTVFVGDSIGGVVALGGRDAPLADFTRTSSSVVVGESITYDASPSTDQGGSIVSYDWDIDGDGVFERSGKSISYRYVQSGEFQVTLKITDDSGRTATHSKRVQVVDPASWPAFGFNIQQTAYNPNGSSLSDLTNVRWTVPTGTAIESTASLEDQTVYIGSKTNVTAINATTGDWMWQFSTGAAIESSPTLYEGTVYVGSNDGKVYALDAETGSQEWSFETGAAVSTAPTVFDRTVFVGATNGRLYALKAGTGSKKWSVNLGNEVSGPAISNGVLYVTVAADNGEDIRVAALDAETGVTKWNVRLAQEWDERTPSKIGAPAVVDGTVYVGGWVNEQTYALDASDGSVSWSTGTGDVVTSPAVAEGVVYVSSQDSRLYALDAATGTKLQSFQTSGPIRSSPVVVGEVVYVGSDDGSMYALNESNLNLLDAFAGDGAIRSSITVVDNTAYFGTSNGTIYSLGSPMKVRAHRNVEDVGWPGETVNVSVKIAVNDSVTGPAFDEDLPAGLSISSWEATPSATFRASETQWIWPNASRGDRLWVNYTVSVPIDASLGTTYDLHGTVSTANQDPAGVNGDLDIPIALCIDRAVAGSDGQIDLRELQQAILWWATDEPVPDTGGETIDFRKVQSLIHAWSQDQSVGCSEELTSTSANNGASPDASTDSQSNAGLSVNLTADSSAVRAGENVTLEVSLNASGYDAPGLNLALPTNWTVLNHSDDGGFYRSSERQWIWLSDGVKQVRITASVPANATRNHSSINVNGSGIDPASSEQVSATDRMNVSINRSIPAIGDFDNPPTDPDGDGFYEDVNGNGEANIVDVQAMFANRNDPNLVGHPGYFDFSGNGDVDIVDVQALFVELSS